jgi:outer membrane protein OmpA-like peptidoglycan-associated protein
MGRFAAIAALFATTALADDPTRRGFDPDPPRPAVGLEGHFTTEGADVPPAGSWRAGAELDFVHGLLALRSGDRRIGWVVEDRLALHLVGARSLGRLELGAALPAALWQRSGVGALAALGVSGSLVDPVASAAVGDLRLQAKAALPSPVAPVQLAVALQLRLPTGDGRAFFSDGWGATPAVVAGGRLGRLRIDGSLGWSFRSPGQYLQLVAHDGLAAGAGASLDLPPWRALREWRAVADVAALVPRGADPASDRYRTPLSFRAGLRARVWRSLFADLGAGTGLAASGDGGYGRESWRLFAGLRWQRTTRDRDGDGVPDDEDRCPDVPGDPRWQGCPTPGDRDGDGVPDDKDLCPEDPGPAALGGCPDTDGDGVPDRIDRCPKAPGPAELEGCPDFDGDGIPDIDDKCPKEPGPAQNDGCPLAEGEPVVEIETTRLSLKDMINFEFGKDTILPQSGKILDEIAAVLRSHGEIEHIRIEGHTDIIGSRAVNLVLSQRRAAAVVRELAARGVPRQRLEAAGYGFDRPVASNATAFGRARNRRVEFNIQPDEAPRPPGDKTR